MLELAWFAAGAVVAGTTLHLLHRRHTRRAAAVAAQAHAMEEHARRLAVQQAAAAMVAAKAPTPTGPSGERVAAAVAEELANLVSAIDLAANDLVACAPEPKAVPRAAERFASEVRRLVVLHRKLELLGDGLATPTERCRCDLEAVLRSLGDALQQSRFGLQVHRDLRPDLPPIAVHCEVLFELLLFACSTMFHRCGATRLCIAAEPALETGNRLRIELMLEWCGEPDRETTAEPAIAALELDVARRLAEAHGGMIQLRRCPNGAVVAVLELPTLGADEREPERTEAAAIAAVAPSTVPETPKAPRHRFGGALVIENDPAIRAMLARELRVQGRAVFTCADAGAARAFLQATPERFEVLILDDDRRLQGGDALGEAIRTLTPGLKICLLGQPATPAGQEWPGIQTLRKPFGVDELRRGLAAILDAG